jgi:hypothetical protein
MLVFPKSKSQLSGRHFQVDPELLKDADSEDVDIDRDDDDC